MATIKTVVLFYRDGSVKLTGYAVENKRQYFKESYIPSLSSVVDLAKPENQSTQIYEREFYRVGGTHHYELFEEV